MEKGGHNFHCVKCKLAYMSFDEMYDHIKKFHVNDLLSALSKVDTVNIPGPSVKLESPKKIAKDDDTEESETKMDTYSEISENDRMQQLIAQRKNHAEILRKHFFGEKSIKTVTEKQRSEGKSCLEKLILGAKTEEEIAIDTAYRERPEPSKSMDKAGQKTFKDLLTTPTTLTKEEFKTPESAPKSSDVHESDSMDEKLVILQISQMENLLTNDLLKIYEEEADEMAARPKTPKSIASLSDIEISDEHLKIIHDDLKITSKTEGEGSEETPQVRVRKGETETEKSDEKMEEDKPAYSMDVSGVNPKYKRRILSDVDDFKVRRQKVVILSSGHIYNRMESVPSTSKQETMGIFVPKSQKEVEYDSDEECYFYVEKEVKEKDIEQEIKDEVTRAILNDKFGEVTTIRVDPYFEYLWKQSFDIKDRLFDDSELVDVVRGHAWSNPQFK